MSAASLFDLTGKRALITGGTHGLGMAMAKGLAQAGATLIINGHTPAKMKIAIEYYKNQGFNVLGYLFDVTDEVQVSASIEQIEREAG
ncbi:MAG TPA: SDR family NAD(P)-dependent oxidoreductase, partial [Cyclobacteriaceae bacterium]|nr:SDR family NAD(P)-dependent oxidoreductase [Cyclobacteriaceae bacterium]